MPQEIMSYIHIYGYLGIFILVFSQEVGLPSPIPNEFVLTFSGFLVFSNALNFGLVVLTALTADIIAAAILYAVFYMFGNVLFKKDRKWIPVHQINKQISKLRLKGVSSVFYGRLTPFIRGYVAVMCGLIKLEPKKYTFITLSTSSIWAAFYVSLGFLLGPYWNYVLQHMSQFKYLFYVVFLVLIVLMISRFIFNKQNNI